MSISRMNKTNKLVICSFFRVLIQQSKSRISQSVHLFVDVFYLVGHMMYSFPPFFDEFCNRTLGIQCLQQFYFINTCQEK